MASNLNQVAVSKLIEYLKIKTVHPDPDYESAIKFLRAYSAEIGFDSFKEVEVSPNRVVCIMTYLGTKPEKQSVLLNSHTDVVPADPKYWKCDPFDGFRDENGDIYARGIQDMKSVGIQHLELIRRMKVNNIRLERTIHVSFVPDEEIGGMTGFGPFLNSTAFKELNVGFALDEGMASPTEEFCLYYTERLPWWIQFTFRGNSGHGSRFIEKTAAEKLQRLLNKALAYREEQKSKQKDTHACLKLGDVTTINLTTLSGGLAQNLVPPEFQATFDIRITPRTSTEEFENMLKSWIEEAEGDDKDSGRITYEFRTEKVSDFAITATDAEKNPWSSVFKSTCSRLGLKYTEEIFPAATDSRYLRERGIPAFGFSPINNTPILLHDHNEFLNENVFLKGIDILYQIVTDLANMP